MPEVPSSDTSAPIRGGTWRRGLHDLPDSHAFSLMTNLHFPAESGRQAYSQLANTSPPRSSRQINDSKGGILPGPCSFLTPLI